MATWATWVFPIRVIVWMLRFCNVSEHTLYQDDTISIVVTKTKPRSA